MIRHHLNIRKTTIPLQLQGPWGVYLNELFRRIATSMVGLFIPLYILKETGKLENIAIFYLIYSLIGFLLAYPGALIIKKVGVDKAMAIGSVCRAVFLYSLIFAKFDHRLFIISSLFFGLAQPFDWLPHYYALSKISKRKKEFSKTASYSRLVTRIGSAIGPVIGGLVIAFFGFTVLYLLAGSLIIVSAITPFLDKFEKVGMHVSRSEIFKRLKDPGIHKHLLSYFISSFDGIVTSIVWPIFLYAALKSYGKSGLLETVSLSLGIIILYLTSLFLKKRQYWIMYLGSVLLILGWLGRVVVSNGLGLTAINFIYLSGITFLWVPLSSLLFAKSVEKKYTMEFWLVHEILCYFFQSISSLIIYLAIIWSFSFKNIIYVTAIINSLTFILPYLYRDYISMMKTKKYAK